VELLAGFDGDNFQDLYVAGVFEFAVDDSM
jgi:hypothetical protein